MSTLHVDQVLKSFHKLAAKQQGWLSSAQLSAATGLSLATLKRQIHKLLDLGLIQKTGSARATRYGLPGQVAPSTGTFAAGLKNNASASASAHSGVVNHVAQPGSVGQKTNPPWSKKSQRVIHYLQQPLMSRAPVSYRRQFVDGYVPNQSRLLPAKLADKLAAEGSIHGQMPAGTYTRRVLEQLLLDLSWQSSRLEGNRLSLLDTEALFKAARPTSTAAQRKTPQDRDAIMLLNHKRAIEFVVDAAPQYGLTESLLRNTHGLLMQDLLQDSSALGTVRQKMVHITGTLYVPAHAPSLLEEMLRLVIERANLIKNPVEAAFFLWVNIAYLQPFEDGNKRTSRLAANIPLMLYNCAPLSFMDIGTHDYAQAMLGVYERQDVSIAADLFAWTYERSMRKYAVILEAASQPDTFRVAQRDNLMHAITDVVAHGRSPSQAAVARKLDRSTAAPFKALLADELAKLTPYNCARYRLNTQAVERWKAARG